MSEAMAAAWIGLGGNLGPVRQTLAAAVQALAELPGTGVVAVSSHYASPAWGPVAQPDYVNAACRLRTVLSPTRLMDALLGIERGFGRDRDASGSSRWGPRPLDLDLLLYDQLQLDSPLLTLPHPRMHERAFVLVPLGELSPRLEVPGRGRVEELLAGLDTTGVEALP